MWEGICVNRFIIFNSSRWFDQLQTSHLPFPRLITKLDYQSIVSFINSLILFLFMISGTDTSIYVWALMTDHVHILLRRSTTALPTFMRSNTENHGFTRGWMSHPNFIERNDVIIFGQLNRVVAARTPAIVWGIYTPNSFWLCHIV